MTGVAAPRDLIAERLRAVVLGLMKAHGMEQKELADRSGEPIYRVHKFVKGDLPFPPLTFLDRVLRVFGSSLAQALEKEPTVKPLPPLPILRDDVLEVARMLERRSPEYVRSLIVLVQERARGRPHGRAVARRRAAS